MLPFKVTSDLRKVTGILASAALETHSNTLVITRTSTQATFTTIGKEHSITYTEQLAPEPITKLATVLKAAADKVQSGTTTLSFSEFRQAVRRAAPRTPIEITSNSVIIDAGGGAYIERACAGQPVDRLPACEPGTPSAEFDAITVHELRNALRCCSEDDTRYILQGVRILASDEEDSHHGFVATDGRRLYHCNSLHLPQLPSIVLPNLQVFHSAPFDCPWKLSTTRELFSVQAGQYTVHGRPIEGNFPNWRQVIPRDTDSRASLILRPESVKRLLNVIPSLPVDPESRGTRTTTLDITPERVMVFGFGSTGVEIPDCTAHGRIRIKFDSELLMAPLSFGLTAMYFIDEISPAWLKDGRRRYILMPMRAC